MSKLLVANWKMNGSISLLNKFSNVMKDPNLVLGLPYPLIPIAKHLCSFANIAAQNCSEFPGHGAYTGEISADMLKDFGANYVIIGHSERRSMMNETPQLINAKVLNSLKSGLKVIYCVSENFETQIKDDLANITYKSQITIAYEPVSAIGTGITPSAKEVENVSKKIRKFLNTNILYGGSVSSKNIMDFLSINSIDGVLVGGASLKVDEIKSMLLQTQASI